MRPCKRFEFLQGERDFRLLNLEEEAFICEHRLECVDCRRQEAMTVNALNMLREAVIDDEVVRAEQFDRRVMRMTKVQAARTGFDYWSPALMGAVLACVALFAALQLVSQPAARSPFAPKGQEAKLQRVGSSYPDLELRGGTIQLR